MVDKAISAAQTGLIDAQARANRLAREIITATGSPALKQGIAPADELTAFSQFTKAFDATNASSEPALKSANSDANTGRPLATPVGVNDQSAGDGDIVRSVVDLKAAEQAFSANAKLLGTLDEMAEDLIKPQSDETA